ncbi:MAG: hypothetical protein QNJ13_07705 [Paracoccaceae bacterium]|nr:hypothetical protein [Paracoccaceae bacterium]
MPSARHLLRQARQVKDARDNHPIARLGTPEFEAEFRASVESNNLDRIDMFGENGNGGVLACLQRWARDRVWLD